VTSRPGPPVVAIVGRPNVGKSSLVNRIARRRVAIVQADPGVTRDANEIECEWQGRDLLVVDTGGVLGEDALADEVSRVAMAAAARADAVVMVVDVRVGVLDEDTRLARELLRLKRPCLLVANKVDNDRFEQDIYPLERLGLGPAWPVSAVHGNGVADLLDAIAELVGLEPEDPASEGSPSADTAEMETGTPSLALIGRPNAGKSTLFNRLVRAERSLVHHVPGTTRDPIDVEIELGGTALRLIDTAGITRKANQADGVDYYSMVRCLQAIDRADVAVLVIDATAGVAHQDQRLAERADAAGCPVIVVLNKWDAVEPEARERIENEVADKLSFVAYLRPLRVSGKTGRGVDKLGPMVAEVLSSYRRRIPTGQLNQAVQRIQSEHPPKGARVLYAVQGASEPPTFTLFTTGSLAPPWLRYLERRLRERFGLGSTALKIRVRRRDGKLS
jgi:GTP-binding protein